MIIEGYEKNGKGFYNQEEFTLEYEIEKQSKKKISEATYLLIYDSLTIMFDFEKKEFISLDSYTNKKNWKYQSQIKIPNIFKKGSLKVKEGFEDTDRYSFSLVPTYEYSSKGILKIYLTTDYQDSIFFLISKDLIVGMKDYKITSFILTKIHYL